MTRRGQCGGGYRRSVFHVPQRSDSAFADALATRLGVERVPHTAVRFINGEMSVSIPATVADEALVVMSPTMDSSAALIELVLLADALLREGVEDITGVLQYLPYSRSDRISRRGEPLGAHAVISMLESTPISRFLVFDLHASAVLGFFTKPVLWVPTLRMLSDAVPIEQPEVVVGPDRGRYDQCVELSRLRNSTFDLLIKVRRDHSGSSELVAGARTQLSGCSILLYDDEIWTGQTSGNTITSFRDAGVAQVHYVSPYDFSSDEVRLRLLNDAGVASFTTTNLARPGDPGLHEKYRVLDVSQLVVDRLRLADSP